MIKSCRDKRTETLFNGYRVPAFSPDLARQAYRKLKLLNAATCLQDLLIPPANRLEALKGEYSIRINSQWRICFVWRDEHAYEVEIVDYH